MTPHKLIPLISEEQIQQKTEELALQISQDYRDKDLLMVGILKGAWVFMADLIRKLTVPVKCDFLSVSSYGSNTESSGRVKILLDLSQPIKEKDVLLIEDIVDTGLTLKCLIENLWLRKPNSLKVCALLDKPSRRAKPIALGYIGFTVPNKFIVGYGIDCAEQYRNLPYIAYLKFDKDQPGETI